jgi:hypothetical protein
MVIETACSDDIYKSKQYHVREDRNVKAITRNLHLKICSYYYLYTFQEECERNRDVIPNSSGLFTVSNCVTVVFCIYLRSRFPVFSCGIVVLGTGLA